MRIKKSECWNKNRLRWKMNVVRATIVDMTLSDFGGCSFSLLCILTNWKIRDDDDIHARIFSRVRSWAIKPLRGRRYVSRSSLPRSRASLIPLNFFNVVKVCNECGLNYPRVLSTYSVFSLEYISVRRWKLWRHVRVNAYFSLSGRVMRAE